MTDFKIRRGLSTQLFLASGELNPQLVIESGCWYLCSDTADLYLGIEDTDNGLTLKRINESVSADFDIDIEEAIQTLRENIIKLENVDLFKKINGPEELPTNFEDAEFNPNITYYVKLTDDRISTYVFDQEAEKYFCTNNIDELVIRAMVSDAIELVLDEKITSVLQEKIVQTIETVILHGGDATPNE